ncbi:heterogeneous nuclear ribonucleoprotein Q isoform X1 [Episyrphus balteatus]|uniref:heterogeneous nuclear ribonucleoprotein Q isoform X1 n=2 Tax=Episyrphus balteatus TaxID=286459 RepID=UPI0024867A27|nr:heterogeneous nuclear ribonucleoprotein Q isoform X1 [Episyrphus balteatus]XP_055852823.1 heterogeneous nuclear ribonucleoprotein Q isoform X1 [Episyrphus balteatus]XP_055852824.1 heterogeneous nuclear ribonucleoprotein Q isoform X1 [Episyrphus balteatus]XP_055852825.1 heterogeneous nuclear ribonucleoprotein Q isoform X1 [Episyrphus balteatus]
MAEGNGELVDDMVTPKSEDRGDGERTEDYPKLLEYGLDKKVAGKLDDIYKTGKLAHVELDERALDALKEFPADGALNVLSQFLESNLEHVSNKSAYLCGVMKTYRQKSRASQQGVPTPSTTAQVKGPDEEKIKKILERSGYTLDVTTGQRKYGGPPPNWDGPTPGNGCEVFCGKIPKDMFEDELIPLFENCGTIWDLRLMMDPMTGTNRGYAFVTFTSRDAAINAVRQLDNHEIKPGKCLKINISVPNLRLFVGNIPKSKGKEEILEEFGKLTAGLVEVIIYSSPDDKKKNRGFCFLEYESHKAASLAKRRLGTGRIKELQVWGCDIIVDWADPQEEPDEQTMSKVKVLYVRNLTQDVSEEKLKEQFEQYGKVERVKKIKDYAFVHFEDRDNAVIAMRGLNGKEVGMSNIEVSLAKPPSDKKKKEEILRARERRMLQMMQGRPGIVGNLSPTHPSMMPMAPMRLPGGPRIPIRAPMARDYDYDYDFYGYSDYRGGYNESFYDEYYRTYDGEYYFDYPPSGVSPIPSGGPPAGEPHRTARNNVEGDGRGRGIMATRGRAAGLRGNIHHLGGLQAVVVGAAAVQRVVATAGAQAATGGVRGAGQIRPNALGTQRAKPLQNLPVVVGKRKFDGGHQNPGDSKRRYASGLIGNGGGSWSSLPLPQQPLGTNGEQWYTDTFPTWS